MSVNLQEEEFKAWLEHPVTKLVKQLLRGKIEFKKEQWAAGLFTDQSQFATAIMNAKAVGSCEAWDEFLAIEYEDLLGESNE